MIAVVTAGGSLAFFASGIVLAVLWAFAEARQTGRPLLGHLLANGGTGPTVLFQICGALLVISGVACLLYWFSS
jgi:hypothetical protein